MSNPTNPLGYVDYEPQSITKSFISILQSTQTGATAFESTTGVVFIEFYAWVANFILYYLERTAEEQYIKTAQRRSSVINLVTLLNYQPYRAVSATGSVTFTLSIANTNQVIIPAKTTLQTTNGYYYVTTQQAIIFAGQTSLSVPVVQGQWVTLPFTSVGGTFQEYTINDTKVENSNLLVYVNGNLYTQVSSFISSGATSTNYRLITNTDNTLTVEFGDNINGAAPNINDSIQITYLKSDGLAGNIYSTNVLTTIVPVIYDNLNNPVTTISVSNPTTILGGADIETTEQIRTNGPQVFSTGDRAVTRNDFIYLISNYPSVASVYVWGENDLTPPNYTAFNSVYVALILQNWQLANTAFQTTLSNYLYSKSSLTIKYVFQTPVVVQIIPVVTVKVFSSYSLTSVQNAISDSYATSFALGTGSTMGGSKRYLDMAVTLSQTPGVSYGYLTPTIYWPLTASYTSSYGYGQILPLLDVKETTVNLYVEGVGLVATDDGAGSWTSMHSGYTFSGGVNYTTGAINATITPTPGVGVNVYVQYQQDQNGDLVVGFNQILQFNSLQVTSISY